MTTAQTLALPSSFLSASGVQDRSIRRLEQIALSIASKKLIAIATGGALAASAVVYSQGDVSGSITGGADFGLEQSLRPIMAEVSLHALLPFVEAEATTTAAIEGETAVDAQSGAGAQGEVQLGTSTPVNVSAGASSAEVAINNAVSNEVAGDASVSAAPGETHVESGTHVALEVAADTSAGAETGIATVTTALASEVDGDLGFGVATR